MTTPVQPTLSPSRKASSVDYGWSLDPRIWASVKEQLADTVWSHTYLEMLYRERVPETSGIYMITASLKLLAIGGPTNDLNNAIYVGQSINIRKRFSQHVNGYGDVTLAKQTFKRLDFWWTPIPAKSLDESEQILLCALGPSANRINVVRREPIRASVGTPVRI